LWKVIYVLSVERKNDEIRHTVSFSLRFVCVKSFCEAFIVALSFVPSVRCEILLIARGSLFIYLLSFIY
jgi:hypothetical protein